MANAALSMQCPSEALLWVKVQSLVKSLFLFTISPRRAKLGGVIRGMRSAGTPPPTLAAGASPAGPWQEPKWVY
jgi:hypothetical protein